MHRMWKKYRTWPHRSKVEWPAFFLIILGFLFSIYGGDIHDWVQGKEGVQVTPYEIPIDCSGMGVTKTITIRNYDDRTVEDYTLTISIPRDASVRHTLREIDSTSLRGGIIGFEFVDENFTYEVYNLASIKPKSVVEFDLTIYPDKCVHPFNVTINTQSIGTFGGRINFVNLSSLP